LPKLAVTRANQSRNLDFAGLAVWNRMPTESDMTEASGLELLCLASARSCASVPKADRCRWRDGFTICGT